jgi:hypothetical protein
MRQRSGMTPENARADPESWLVFVPPRLRMYRLAAHEHRHELRDLAGTSLGPLHRLDAMQNRVAILAGEPSEHRLRLRFSRKRSRQVVGHAGRRGAGVGSVPTSVGLARSTSAIPEACILPSLISRSASVVFRFDQRLRARLGVKRSKYVRSSRRRT